MRNSASIAVPRSGFTLIELMVVITLVAVLSALILPEMRGGLEDAQLRSASRRWIELFGLAGSRAVANNEHLRVHFDKSRGRYQLERQTGRDRRQVRFAPVNDSSIFSGEVDPRISISIRPLPATPISTPADGPSRAAPPDSRPGRNPGPPPTAVNFFPDGTCDGVEVELRDLSDHRIVLRLNPVTARVTVRPSP